MGKLAGRFGEFMLTIDSKETIRTIWTANEKILPRRAQVLVGKKLREVICGEQYVAIRNILQRVWERGHVERIEYPAEIAGGTRWFVARLMPLARRWKGHGTVCVMAWDITDRKMAEQNLRKSQALLAESEQLANIGSWELDLKTGKVAWSDNMYRVHGFAFGEVVLSKDFCLQLLHPDDRQHAENLVAQSFVTRLPAEHEYRCAIRDGRLRRMQTRFAPFFSESGEPLRIVGSTQDVTDHRLAEERIQKSEALLVEAEQIAHMGSWEWDLETRAIRWSDNMYRLRGFAPGEVALSEEVCSALFKPADRERARDLLAKAIESGQLGEHEFRGEIKNGSIRAFHTRFAPVFSDSGRVVRIVGTTQDITDRKLAEEKIQKSEAMLAQAERIANLGSWEWDLETNEVIWSEQSYRMAEVDPSERPPSLETWWTWVHPGDRDRLRGLLEQTLTEGAPLEYEARFLRRGDRVQVMHTRALPIVNEAGRPIRLVGMSQDVTERRNEENRLRRSEALLEQAEQIAGFGCWEYDIATRTVILSKNLLEMYGFVSNEEWDEERYWKNVLRSDREEVRRMVLESIGACKPFEYITRYRMPDGTARNHHVRGMPVVANKGPATLVRGVVHDITSQMRNEEDLRRLSQELMRAQDAERRQIARELHESAGQTLAALKMTLANLEDASGDNREEFGDQLLTARGLAEDAIREVRVVSYLMHPPMLDEAGLGPTLHWYAKGFAERSGIETVVEATAV
jgi:PAS domain S-box-containing protein